MTEAVKADDAPTLSGLRERRAEIVAIAASHGASNVRVFGSVGRAEANRRSDVDLVVDFEAGRGLLDLGGLHTDLLELLGRQVDVVTPASLKPRVRDRVLAEAIAL